MEKLLKGSFVCTVIYAILKILFWFCEKKFLYVVSYHVWCVSQEHPMINVWMVCFHVLVLSVSYRLLKKSLYTKTRTIETSVLVAVGILLIVGLYASYVNEFVLFNARQFEIYQFTSYNGIKAFLGLATEPFLIAAYFLVIISAARSFEEKRDRIKIEREQYNAKI